jgi:hypothetical protein
MSTKVFRNPQDFVAARGQGCEAVVVRIGLNDAQVVVVDEEGAWDRWIYRSVDEAKAAADELDIDVHMNEYPEELRVRMNAYRRPQESFQSGAYPEQGEVGPVIPYPENRPRRVEVAEARKKAEGTEDSRPAHGDET